jgi:hypothetical protein
MKFRSTSFADYVVDLFVPRYLSSTISRHIFVNMHEPFLLYPTEFCCSKRAGRCRCAVAIGIMQRHRCDGPFDVARVKMAKKIVFL